MLLGCACLLEYLVFDPMLFLADCSAENPRAFSQGLEDDKRPHCPFLIQKSVYQVAI